MRYLVISPQPFFTPRGTPFSVYYRTLILSELGAEIDLVTYGQGADPDIPNVRIFRTPRFRWLGSDLRSFARHRRLRRRCDKRRLSLEGKLGRV